MMKPECMWLSKPCKNGGAASVALDARIGLGGQAERANEETT